MKKIKFASKEEHLVYPQPARKYIPEWYKKAERFVGGKPIIATGSDLGQSTVKACVPFLDSLTTGYIVELWQDVQVSIRDGMPYMNWNSTPTPAALRGMDILQGMPMGESNLNFHLAWENPFYLQTPKGYSLLITHPLNRFDLPFTTTSGVVDADSIMTNGSVPFILKEGFEGFIPKGTPIMQIIPFKRDDWESEVDESIIAASANFASNVRRVFTGWYKKNNWVKKTYN